MAIYKIKDEKGEDNELLHDFKMHDKPLKWLMFATGWEESAMVTTYIINGNRDNNYEQYHQQLKSHMDMILEQQQKRKFKKLEKFSMKSRDAKLVG